MNEIQLNTLLGNFWEQVVADNLGSIGVQYDRSPDLGVGIISPDFVCAKQKTTVFVTSTGTRESFIKKRWRYINELFQVKGVLGDSMLVANLVLASKANLQDLEETVFKGLFDIAGFGDDFPDFDKHYNWARDELKSGQGVATVATAFNASGKAKHFRDNLKKWLNAALSAKPAQLGGLWSAVAKYQSGRKVQQIKPNSSTYWRWSCLKLLPLTLHERKAIIGGLGGKAIKVDDSRLKHAGIDCAKTIGGVRVKDASIAATLRVFGPAQLLTTLKTLDVDNSTIGFPLHEVVDEASVKRAFAACHKGFSDSKSFVKLAQAEFNRPSSERITIWEYGIALADTSALDVNKEYVRSWGKIVVANPINNVILKTDIAQTIAEKGNIDEIIERASEIIWQRMPGKITEAVFIDRVMDYRKRSLFLQPYLNPTQRRFESVCSAVFGVTPMLSKHDGLLRDIGIKGRASRVEAIYILERDNTFWIFKVLSGYKGGYEHKADEMAARAWLLRFRLDVANNKAFIAPVKLIFVYEGEWEEKYLTLLHASGWDEIVHLAKIETFLKKLP